MEQKDKAMQHFTELVFMQKDIEKNKTMAGLSYFLFFLPLIVCPLSASLPS